MTNGELEELKVLLNETKETFEGRLNEIEEELKYLRWVTFLVAERTYWLSRLEERVELDRKLRKI